MNEHELLMAVADAAEAFLESPDALEELRRRVKTLRNYQEHGNEADRPGVSIRTQTCKYCEALFFFARFTDQLEGENKPDDAYADLVGARRWVPLELDPIDAEGVLPEWRWLVDFRAYPPVTWVEAEWVGPVYVDHRQTCARREDGPVKRCIPYLRRWKVNSTKINAETENESIRAANDLLAFQRRLADRQEHDDS